MKKLLSTLLVLLCIPALFGCGKDKGSSNVNFWTEPTTTSPVISVEDTTMPVDSVATSTESIPVITAPTDFTIPAIEVPTEAEPSVPITEAPTKTEPSVPTTQATETDANLITGFDKNQRRKINIFLSNFAEQGFACYPADDAELLDFVYIYCKINRNKALLSNTESYYVTQATVDDILTRFFGKTVKPGTDYKVYSSELTYQDGNYYWPLADGVMYDYVAIATDMRKNANGTYTVQFDIYEAFEVSSLKDCYYMSPAEAAGNSKMHKIASGQAVVKDYAPKDSYQIISYQEL